MQRSMLTRLSTALIIPAMVLLSSAAAAQDATPGAATDRATTAEVEKMLGPVPTPSQPWKICAIEKTLINEHWQQIKQGYEDAAAKYGVQVEVQASKDESDLTGQLAIAEAMLQGDCDAFAVSPLSSSNLQPFLDRAARPASRSSTSTTPRLTRTSSSAATIVRWASWQPSTSPNSCPTAARSPRSKGRQVLRPRSSESTASRPRRRACQSPACRQPTGRLGSPQGAGRGGQYHAGQPGRKGVLREQRHDGPRRRRGGFQRWQDGRDHRRRH